MTAGTIELPTVDDVLSVRRKAARAAGFLSPRSIGKALTLATAALASPEIDAAKMCASAIICTDDVDRQEDVIRPAGVDVVNYARNPVVYFDHGFSGISIPIASSENPENSKLALVKGDGLIKATSWFQQSIPESCQVFALVQAGLVRTASIQVLPRIARVRSRNNPDRPGLEVAESEMVEWSWTGIPMNPNCEGIGETIRKMLDVGKLADAPICEPLLKMLTPLAAQPARNVVPVEATIVPDPAPTETPAAPVAPLKKSASGEAEKPKPGDAGPEDVTEGERQAMPSEKHLGAAHGGLKALAAKVRKAASVNENPAAKEHLSATADALDGMAAETEKVYAKACEGAPGLAKEADVDEEAMRKFLGEGQMARLRFGGLLSSLETVATAKGLDAGQKLIAGETITRLTKMLGEARDFARKAAEKPADPPAKTEAKLDPPADEAEWAELRKSLLRSMTTINDLVPANAK